LQGLGAVGRVACVGGEQELLPGPFEVAGPEGGERAGLLVGLLEAALGQGLVFEAPGAPCFTGRDGRRERGGGREGALGGPPGEQFGSEPAGGRHAAEPLQQQARCGVEVALIPQQAAKCEQRCGGALQARERCEPVACSAGAAVGGERSGERGLGERVLLPASDGPFEQGSGEVGTLGLGKPGELGVGVCAAPELERRVACAVAGGESVQELFVARVLRELEPPERWRCGLGEQAPIERIGERCAELSDGVGAAERCDAGASRPGGSHGSRKSGTLFRGWGDPEAEPQLAGRGGNDGTDADGAATELDPAVAAVALEAPVAVDPKQFALLKLDAERVIGRHRDDRPPLTLHFEPAFDEVEAHAAGGDFGRSAGLLHFEGWEGEPIQGICGCQDCVAGCSERRVEPSRRIKREGAGNAKVG
jgi:hypothetical protein